MKLRPPIKFDNGRLRLDPQLASATVDLALAECRSRGAVVRTDDLISIYHEQAGSESDIEMPDVFIDSWGIYPAQLIRQCAFAWRLPKNHWAAITAPIGVEAFCNSHMPQFECVSSAAQLAKRFGFAFIPLTAFRLPNAVACPDTCMAIRNADRAYRLLTEHAPIRFDL